MHGASTATTTVLGLVLGLVLASATAVGCADDTPRPALPITGCSTAILDIAEPPRHIRTPVQALLGAATSYAELPDDPSRYRRDDDADDPDRVVFWIAEPDLAAEVWVIGDDDSGWFADQITLCSRE
jgi:hypothetical protein